MVWPTYQILVTPHPLRVTGMCSFVAGGLLRADGGPGEAAIGRGEGASGGHVPHQGHPRWEHGGRGHPQGRGAALLPDCRHDARHPAECAMR